MAEGVVLRAAIGLRQGSLDLDVEFALNAPWSCLFGASGSGKTTVLRAIAGLTRPDQGRIEVFGRMVLDRASGAWVAPHERQVKYAAQQAWLFPGSVWENVCYGARRGEGGEQVLELFRLTEHKNSSVRALSGGERQRVSVARAVAAAAFGEDAVAGRRQLLLLDEPFAGMDLMLRDRLAVELRDWLAVRGIVVLSVTHDVSEALLLDAEIVRMVEGRITAQGPARDVLAEERARLQDILS